MSIKKEGIVSVDVSKSYLTYQPWSGYCEPRAKPKKCPMRIGAMSEIAGLAVEMAALCGNEPTVAFEDTGVYGRPLIAFLESKGIKAARMSPLLSAKVAKANDKPVKTDAIDCSTIAEVYYCFSGDCSRASLRQSGNLLFLRAPIRVSECEEWSTSNHHNGMPFRHDERLVNRMIS